METSALLKILNNHQNKLLTAQFSLIENIKHTGIAPVDMADFVDVTAHSNSMFLILEKQLFTNIAHSLQKIIIDDLPKTVKSIWIDIWIGKAFSESIFDIHHKINDKLKKMLSDNVEMFVIDGYNEGNQQNSISIIAFD